MTDLSTPTAGVPHGGAVAGTAVTDNAVAAGAVAGSALVGIVMGSDSDWPVMEAAAAALSEFGIPFETDVVSAHRMPAEMIAYGQNAAARGIRVIIAGAGGAAHLPGMLASVTTLPVVGVPVPLKTLDGMDSLLSIVQMPAGVPVAAVSIGGARNAGLLAVRMLASGTDELAAGLASRLAVFAQSLNDQASAKGAALREKAGASYPLAVLPELAGTAEGAGQNA